MQSLSQMLSPLKNCGPNSSNQDDQLTHTSGDMSAMDFQTPLSITIPPNEYDEMEIQQIGNHDLKYDQNQIWHQTYNQQTLLTSKTPEEDRLTSLNLQLGNQYTYQMHEMEPGTNGYYNQLCSNDPRTNYDNSTFSSAQIGPFKDDYYQCAYEQPKKERTAIRHKMEDEDIGPGAKRPCAELSSGNEQREIVRNTVGNVSSTTNEETRI